MTESRFSEVAVLRTTHWLEIEGKIKTGMLLSNTKYGAYLVIKIRHNAYGLDSEKAELSVQVRDGQAWTGSAYLQSILERITDNLNIPSTEKNNFTEILSDNKESK
ncbi:hypothetical protein LWI29_011050 [Acer saccharum]|uniref:Uncharacterized protein n=1 Tax=Acer saccharum TaxID=4024 RepID=A0AA39T479_ACESA|nr:hypothetical protein LWI29_011050 [Acer saccharum]